MSSRKPPRASAHPTTPDGRYFVVRGRLWRKANPALDASARDELVQRLMEARRALRSDAPFDGRRRARAQVDAAKRALGERGPVWWTDGAPDYNRRLARNTPYAAWFEDPTPRSGEGTAVAMPGDTTDKADMDSINRQQPEANRQDLSGADAVERV